jgi:hypothetical protein
MSHIAYFSTVNIINLTMVLFRFLSILLYKLLMHSNTENKLIFSMKRMRISMQQKRLF